ncbi:PAS domain-containing protein [Luteithermobacter gelatinilyticus]|uniref:PAS domain-containing protein n=1 Tax=Luteithermobacter gelatinilyticus TaxID=2582913 RepID=UPI001105B8F5|nr:PAS domain-containing protein [Luteithermobacter gelatinilyticus]
MNKIIPTTQEVTFGENELIVSKTDLKGRITYTNHVFQNVSGFEEAELMGQPHNVIRHPDMPRCIFKVLWERLQSGNEVFAYIKNICKSGAYYWVFAHVTPSFGSEGTIIGYHSSRRLPERRKIAMVEQLYQYLKKIEDDAPNSKEGMALAYARLQELLAEQNISFDHFTFEIEQYFHRLTFDKTSTEYRLVG